MAVSHDLELAAQGIAQAHTRYAMELAGWSTRVGHLATQVFGCVARGQLHPEVIEASLDLFGQRSGAAIETDVQGAIRRFADGLSAARAGPDGGEEEKIGRDLQAVAAGERSVGHSRRGYRTAMGRSMAREIEGAAQHWFELLAELARLRAAAAEEFLLEVLRAAAPIGFSGDVIRVDGALGDLASTEIELVNEGDRMMRLRGSVGSLRRSDGVDAAFTPVPDTGSPDVSLDPGGSARLGISLSLIPDLFRAGQSYVGTVEIVEDVGVLLSVPLLVEVSGPS